MQARRELLHRGVDGVARAVASWDKDLSEREPTIAAEPLRLHPETPHYFLWRDKPTVLIGSGEHYDAVINLDFDYLKDLETLKADGLNQIRIFSGTFREVVDVPSCAPDECARRFRPHRICEHRGRFSSRCALARVSSRLVTSRSSAVSPSSHLSSQRASSLAIAEMARF